MEEDAGWSAPVSKGGKPRSEQKKLLLQPTSLSSKDAPSERKPRSSTPATSTTSNATKKPTVSSAVRPASAPKGPSVRAAAPPKGVSAQSKQADRPADAAKKERKVPTFSIERASADAFPALGASARPVPPLPIGALSVRARLRDVGSSPGQPHKPEGTVAAAATAKRSTKVSLFDIIMKSTTKDVAKTAVKPTAKVPLKAAVAAVSAKHVVRKRKKRATNLKKKLLKERQRYHERMHPPPALNQPETAAVPGATPSARLTVALSRFIDDSIEDEDELEEVLDSARELMRAFGSLRGMSVSGPPDSRILLVTFAEAAAAAQAWEAMDGSVYGGIAVQAALVDTPSQAGGAPSAVRAEKPASPAGAAVPRGTPNTAHSVRVLRGVDNDARRNYDSHSIVCIYNFVFPEDIEDEDEAQDVLNDTQMLCEKFSPAALWLENFDSDSFVPITSSASIVTTDLACPLGILTFNSVDAAVSCRDFISTSSDLSAFVLSSNCTESRALSLGNMFGAEVNSDSCRNCCRIGDSDSKTIGMNTNFCLKIRGFVTKEDIIDEDERADIVSELRDLCEAKLTEYGSRLNPPPTALSVDCVLFGKSAADTAEDGQARLDVYIMVNIEKHLLQDAVFIHHALDGVTVGGSALEISICCIANSALSGLLASQASSPDDVVRSVKGLDGCLVAFDDADVQELSPSAAGGDTTVVVFGLPWQVQSSSSAAETDALSPAALLQHSLWRFEWKLDLLRVCGCPSTAAMLNTVLDEPVAQPQPIGESKPPDFFSHVVYVSVTGFSFPVAGQLIGEECESGMANKTQAPGLEVCVAFESPDDALAAQLYLDHLIIGGAELSVSVRIGRPEAALIQARARTTSAGSGGSFDSLGALTSSGLSASAPVFMPRTAQSPSTPERNARSPLVAAAAHTPPPRLPRRTTVNNDIKHASPEINDLIKTFLSSLAIFQKRVKETDPLNFNRKRRLMFGMKQVRNAIKSGRAKIVFIAPDFEDSEALDEKLDELIDEANAKGTPLMYCLSRRQLAKAAGTSMRQVVVGVLDADGAYDAFKLINKFLAATE